MLRWIFFVLLFTTVSIEAWLSEPSGEMQEAVASFLLPDDHPIAEVLDEIFSHSRVTTKLRTLEQADFYDIDLRKRGITFARHPLLPGYVLKIVLDYTGQSKNNWTDKYRKQDEYIELTGRIRKRNEIQKFIDDYRLEAFITPQKWIYPLPTHVNPPKNATMIKKFYILVAEDMDIEPSSISRNLWKTVPDEEFINDYFFIVTSLNLYDIGPPNQSFTRSGHVAFIDTKDWKNKAFKNWDRASHFFSKEMGLHWKYLLEAGLPENWRQTAKFEQ